MEPAHDDSPMVNVGVHVASLSADESFVNFDFASASAKFQKRLSLHRETDSVKHEPCGLLSDAERTVDFVGANTIFAIRKRAK